MSEVIEKKSGITFSYEKSVENQTTIVAHADDKELPIILAILVRKNDTAWWIGVTDTPFAIAAEGSLKRLRVKLFADAFLGLASAAA